MHHPTDMITHTTAFVTPVMEHWLEREIAQWVHPMKDRSDDPSHHERTLLPRSYISLPWLKREIAQWVHPMKDRSDDPLHHERTLLPRSYTETTFVKSGVCVPYLSTNNKNLTSIVRSKMYLCCKSVRLWCDGSSDRSFMEYLCHIFLQIIIFYFYS